MLAVALSPGLRAQEPARLETVVIETGQGRFEGDGVDYEINLDRALVCGMLPEPYLEPDAAASVKLLRSYASTYLKEEIQAETLVRNIEKFARFLNTAAAVSGKICDFGQVRRDRQGRSQIAARVPAVLPARTPLRGRRHARAEAQHRRDSHRQLG